MHQFTKTFVSDHSAKSLYDLVNDTESYQQFIPYCQQSSVLEDLGDEKLCRLVFGQGILQRSLETRNKLAPNQRIEILLSKGDFKHLYGLWVFEQGKQSKVTVSFEYAFSNPWVEHTFGLLFNTVTERIIQVFQERADDLLR